MAMKVTGMGGRPPRMRACRVGRGHGRRERVQSRASATKQRPDPGDRAGRRVLAGAWHGRACR